jgi:hypothetical protein
MLEIDSLLPSGQVGASQISGSTNEFRNDIRERSQDSLRQLASSNSGVSRSVTGKSLLPAFRKLASKTTLKLSSLSGVFLLVLGNKFVPFSLSLGTLLSTLSPEIVDLLGNNVLLIRVETELLLDILDIINCNWRFYLLAKCK